MLTAVTPDALVPQGHPIIRIKLMDQVESLGDVVCEAFNFDSLVKSHD